MDMATTETNPPDLWRKVVGLIKAYFWEEWLAEEYMWQAVVLILKSEK